MLRPLSRLIVSRTESGAALLLAATASALLAAAGVVMLTEARGARAGASETLRVERARLHAEAVLARAIVALDEGLSPPRGLVFEDGVGGRAFRQDAPGLVDINAADPTLLAALLRALGVPQEEAVRLADHVADWRDGDDLVRLNGAEAATYAEAGLPPPGDRPFLVETELVSVLGVTPALVQCLAPYITVHSGAGSIDPAAAPPFLREALGVAAPSGAMPAAPIGRIVIVTAEAPISADAVLQLRRWIRLTGDPGAPVLVHRASASLAPRRETESACVLEQTA